MVKINSSLPSGVTQISLDLWRGPGQLNLLKNTFGISLVFQSDGVAPDDVLPEIYAYFVDGKLEVVVWDKFPGASFWRSQRLDEQALKSFEFRNADSDWQMFVIER